MPILVLYAIIFIILVALIYSILTTNKNHRKIIQGSLAVMAFASGIVIYLYGYMSSGEQPLTSILSAVWSSIRMFLNEDDRAVLVESPFYRNTPAIAPVFWITHLTALFVTIGAVIGAFAKKLINNVRIMNYRRLIGNKTHYIIIGYGYAARVFAENLRKSDKKCAVTYITGESESAEADAYYNSLLDKGFAAISGKADVVTLKKSGVFIKNQSIKIICMSEKDEVNLEVGKILAEGFNNSKNESVTAYIMYSNTEKTEYFAFAEKVNGRIRFFNTYELCARDFFSKHPITGMINDFIDTDKARLKGDLNEDDRIIKDNGSEYVIKSIFVGFGDQNYQMLKTNIISGQLLGAGYNAVVYDMNITINEARFRHSSPGLFPGGDEDNKNEEYFVSPSEKYNIVFKNINVVSNDFTNDLISEIESSDFAAIYIALGNDKLSAEIADDIRLAICRNTSITTNNVRIFVKTAEHTVFSECNENSRIIISFFGYDSEIISPNNIINANLDSLAKAISSENSKNKWDTTLTDFERNDGRDRALHLRVKLNLMGFDLMEGNSRLENNIDKFKAKYKSMYQASDDYNIYTDALVDNLARLEHQRWNAFYLVNGWTKLPKKFVTGEKRKDEAVKQQACLTSFGGLVELRNLQAERSGDTTKSGSDFDTIKYDYRVMDELVDNLNNDTSVNKYFITEQKTNKTEAENCL
jgi:hypothetical protein